MYNIGKPSDLPVTCSINNSYKFNSPSFFFLTYTNLYKYRHLEENVKGKNNCVINVTLI